MYLPLRFKYNYRGPTKCSLFFPYSFWDFCGFRHTGRCIVMLTSLISGFPRTADGPVHTLVSWSRNPVSAPFFHVEFWAWFSLALISRVQHFHDAAGDDRLLERLWGYRLSLRGTEQQRHRIGWGCSLPPSAWQHFSPWPLPGAILFGSLSLPPSTSLLLSLLLPWNPPSSFFIS